MAKGYFTATDIKARMKRCPVCQHVRPFSEFARSTANQGQPRIAAFCKDCFNRYQREWRKKNLDRGVKYAKDANLKRACAEQGITLEAYYEMVQRQGGVCAICKQPQRNARWGRLAIDHDHMTGEFRGLLCMACNSGLGYFGDNIAIMQAAVEYIRASKPLFQVVNGTED